MEQLELDLDDSNLELNFSGEAFDDPTGQSAFEAAIALQNFLVNHDLRLEEVLDITKVLSIIRHHNKGHYTND